MAPAPFEFANTCLPALNSFGAVKKIHPWKGKVQLFHLFNAPVPLSIVLPYRVSKWMAIGNLSALIVPAPSYSFLTRSSI